MKRILLFALLTFALAFSATAATGDVNSDGEVNISDVNALIDMILSEDSGAAGDVNGDGEINISDVNALIDIILGGGVVDELTPKDIELDFSALTEGTEVIQEDEDEEDYGDYVENTSWSTTVNITFDGETATVTGNPSSVFVAIDGAHVTITSTAKRVRYIVTGTTPNGSLKFYGDKKFQLQLNGADITNPTGAAINNQCGKSFYLVLNAGTVNTLRDGENYTMVDGEDQKGALFVINMEIAADGAKGINCDSLVYITGGRTTIITSGTSRLELDEQGNEVSTGVAGVKADWNITMTGGTLNIKCTGNDAKGINVAQPLLFTGGELNVVVTGKKNTVDPKGVKCDTDCTIQGGSFYSCAPNGRAIDIEGTLTIADGYTTLNNSDERLIEIAY